MSFFVKFIGYLYRNIPLTRGKYFFAGNFLAPLLRGKGHEVVVGMKNPGGGKLLCHLDDWISWNVFVFGRYIAERRCEDYMLSQICRKDMTIFDVGANIGYYTIQFARLAGPGSLVHAFEPLSFQGDILAKNIKGNKLDNIIFNKLIVSDEVGRKKIYFSSRENSGRSSLAHESPQCEEVECTTLDAYCEARQIDSIDLIKIDVEGHELNVLKGMQHLLGKSLVRLIFIEINSENLSAHGASIEELLDYMATHGYRAYSIQSSPPRPFAPTTSENLVLFEK